MKSKQKWRVTSSYSLSSLVRCEPQLHPCLSSPTTIKLAAQRRTPSTPVLSFSQRLQLLSEHSHLLTGIKRGIEKESLRINPDGRLSTEPHPQGLGSALTHSCITTDYSEALLEFITPVSTSISGSLGKLSEIHRYVYAELDNELLWGASMPCLLEGDEGIPIARYGSSNIATMKQVYRAGLGHRYGRLMQTIAGIHYNFSMPDEYWPLAQAAAGDTRSGKTYRTESYFGLIRNFRRYSWLLIYLFGSSPAVCSSFLRGSTRHTLEPLDERGRTLHAPLGTSLRMGDLGYQSNAQGGLNICYNTLENYVETLHKAITTPHPDYEDIGTVVDGDYRQLNTALLQIENEFYSAIRPKRVTRSGETPLGALCTDGVEYIEVRCLDINPMLPVGLDEVEIRFVDTFLIYCLLCDSPACDDAETQAMESNLFRVVNRGRDPELQLVDGAVQRSLPSWGEALLVAMEPIAQALDSAHGGDAYILALESQRGKLRDPALTPSAMLLAEMNQRDMPFFRLAMDYSQRWAMAFKQEPLSAAVQQAYAEDACVSLRAQEHIEASDSVSFAEFLDAYYAQYQALPC